MAIDNDNMSRAAKCKISTNTGAIAKNQILPYLVSSRVANLRKFNVEVVTTVATSDWTINFGNTTSSTAYGTMTIPIGSAAGVYSFTFAAGVQAAAGTAVLTTSPNSGGNGNGYGSLEYDLVDDIPQVVN